MNTKKVALFLGLVMLAACGAADTSEETDGAGADSSESEENLDTRSDGVTVGQWTKVCWGAAGFTPHGGWYCSNHTKVFHAGHPVFVHSKNWLPAWCVGYGSLVSDPWGNYGWMRTAALCD